MRRYFSPRIFPAAAWLVGLFVLLANGATAGAPTPAQCASRINDTASRLVACIQKDALWNHLVDFQHIADQNPGPDGHGNRDSGQPGYYASVQYVAALMRQAGYAVVFQPYQYKGFRLVGTPSLTIPGMKTDHGVDWFVARLSGDGVVTAPVQPAASGCSARDFAKFTRGNIALVRRGACSFDQQTANAQAAGAGGLIIYNGDAGPSPFRKGAHSPSGAWQALLTHDAGIPVAGVASPAVGQALLRAYLVGAAPVAHLEVHTDHHPVTTDYNLIADSPYGDTAHTVVVEGHLDSIYDAGILDNASGSATILEVALQMARTQTRNHLRYIWFGGEEINLLGSAWYTKTLTAAQRSQIAFDVDADVTATPNYDILIADPANAPNVHRFPANVVPASVLGNRYFSTYFASVGIPVQSASFGNDGTDSNSFSLIGIPNTGILTQQDCCKSKKEVNVWGGYLGNYEGKIPGSNGGCVDHPRRWCDNLSNNDPIVFESVSKGVAYVVFELANDPSLSGG